MQEKLSFDSSKHVVVSFDATKLYPSVNVNRVLTLILKLLYKYPEYYFPKEFDFEGNLLPKPERENV